MKDFKSISQIMAAICNHITLPYDWEEIINIPNKSPIIGLINDEDPEGFWQSSYNLHAGMLRRSLARSYKTWQAAARLDMVLRNNAELVPQWYDTKDTDFFKKNLNAHAEVERILVGMARHFEGVIKYRHEGTYPDSSDMGSIYPRSNDLERLNQVGFDYVDLCEFFEKINVVNPFKEANGTEIQELRDAHLECGQPNEAKTEVISHVELNAERRKIQFDAERKDILAPIIEDLVNELKRDDTSMVFLHLREMAIDEKPPFKGVAENGRLMYMDFEYELRYLSKDNLYHRLRRRSGKN